MRKLYSLLTIAVILVAGCSGGSSSSPSGVVNSYLTAMKEGDLEKIKTYITESDLSLLNLGQQMAEKMGSKDEMSKKMSEEFKNKAKSATFAVKGEKVEGEKATVDVEITENGKSDTHPFELKKEKGEWKISLLSTGMNGMSKEKRDEVANGLNELKNVNLDSLKSLMKNINLDSLKDVIKKGTEGMDKIKDELQKLKTN